MVSVFFFLVWIPRRSQFWPLYSFSFDSIQDGSVAICTPHTAFSDPTTPEGTPLRQSIELRALVFYDSWELGYDNIDIVGISGAMRGTTNVENEKIIRNALFVYSGRKAKFPWIWFSTALKYGLTFEGLNRDVQGFSVLLWMIARLNVKPGLQFADVIIKSLPNSAWLIFAHCKTQDLFFASCWNKLSRCEELRTQEVKVK